MSKFYTVDEIIAYARKNSKYYADLYKNLPENVALEDLPLIDQDHFWKNCDKNGGIVATRVQTDGQIFKSGGTTGDPKYSLYTAEEWETMCQCSGAVLARGGLKNGDKIANLFYAGALYALSVHLQYALFCTCKNHYVQSLRQYINRRNCYNYFATQDKLHSRSSLYAYQNCILYKREQPHGL